MWPKSALMIALVLGLVGCRRDKLDPATPWVVVLDESPNPSVARSRASLLAERIPALQEESLAFGVREMGVVRYLVTSRGFKTEQEARDLAERLAKPAPVQLRLVDISKLTTTDADASMESAVPEDGEALQRLASFLPDPGETELLAFLLESSPEAARSAIPRPHFSEASASFFLDFGEIGFQSAAHAVYKVREDKDAGRGRIYAFAGLAAEAMGDEAAVRRRATGYLQERIGRNREEWDKLEEEKKQAARLKAKRGRPKATKKKRRTPEVKPEAVAEPALPAPLPAPVKRFLPWGEGTVQAVAPVAMGKREHQNRATRVYNAWVTFDPRNRVLLLLLFDGSNQESVLRLLMPHGLGEPNGLAFTPSLLDAWRVIPEVSVEGERLSILAMDRFEVLMDASARKGDLGWRHGERRLVTAGYRPFGEMARSGSSWQVSWVEFGNEAEAENVMDLVFINPRKERIQNLLKSKRKVSYEVAMNLREIYGVLCYHLQGAKGGSLQEFYFRKGNRVLLAQAPYRGPTRVEPDAVAARMELLQIWAQPKENT